MPAMSVSRSAGLTAIEALVVVAIMVILLGVGMPSMSNWLLGRKAAGAAEFYRDALMLARNQAIAHNSASRLVLSENAANGQYDWRVDICFPDSSVRCDDASNAWSTASAPAAGDPDQTGGYRSVARSATGLPGQDALVIAPDPDGADAVYFTPLGWIDTTVATPLRRIGLAPGAARVGAFRSLAVAVTLAGVAATCDPVAPSHDTRGCPP